MKEDCSDPMGWDWVDEDTVVFCEGACEAVKSGEWDKITATFGCETITIIE